MPVTSYSSVSNVPPLVAVSCYPDAFTSRVILRSRAFSLCFLDRNHIPAIEFLATHSGRMSTDKLSDAGLGHKEGKKLAVPVIDGSAAALECTLRTKRKVGDHVLMVGKVEAAYASEDFKDYWRFRDYKPIMYTGWRGRLTTFDS